MMDRLWALHNEVRAFYKKLGTGERIRVALRSDDNAELDRTVPKDADALLRALRAKSRNADLSELIRLGKLVVHAADMRIDTIENAQAEFDARMNHLVTSDGQSEIKRNEAFTRVWRNTVGLTQRTLKAWIDPNEQAQAEPDDEDTARINKDLFSEDVIQVALANLDTAHFASH
jgi:hypothetical protein